MDAGLLEFAVEKPIQEWKNRLRGLDAQPLIDAWRKRAGDSASWMDDVNFHVAAAERMKQLGFMAIDLDDDVRKVLNDQAHSILEKLQRQLHDDPERLAEIQEITSHSDAYYEKYGKLTARYYMYEQGIIDLLGDRIAS